MELVSLEVERFGCIAKTRIGFQPGLNVLHGANEVGKSSIARAIRFALLLPSSSREALAWVPWTGGGDPTVTLAFRMGPTDYFRVKKIFGTNTASLERSSDGLGWANLARAREVEGRLRTLLRWGIPEPGGANAPKGLPESFLASALLADQEGVLSVFDTNLDSDGVDSGRTRIRAALEAIAQDPLFKAVLDAAQARVDEAFTSTGQRKRGGGGPFKRLAEEMTALQKEHDEAAQAAEGARLLSQRVADLQRDTATADGDLQEAAEKREGLEQRRKRQNAYAAAAAARRAAQVLVDAVVEARSKSENAAATLSALESQLPAHRTTDEEASKTFEAATAAASTVREIRRGELAQEETAILREREFLRVRHERVEAALNLQRADEARRQGDVVADTIGTLDREVATLEAVEPWQDLRTLQNAFALAERRETEIGQLQSAATSLRDRAKDEWPSKRSGLLPDARQLAELGRLRGKVELAEAKLEVGLSVEVRGVPSVSVSVDNSPKETKKSPLAIEARKWAKFEFANGGEVLVRGGRPADRENAERAQAQWHEATSSLFQSVGVSDFAGLEEACRVDAEGKMRAEALQREAISVEATRTALGDPSAEKDRQTSRIRELQCRLEGADVVAIEVTANAFGATARSVLTKKMAERELKRAELANLRAKESALRELTSKDPDGPGIDDLDIEIDALRIGAEKLAARERKIVEDRNALALPPATHELLEIAAKSAKRLLEDARAQIKTATSERDVWGARLQERLGPASGVDIDLLKAAEDAAREATRNDGPLVDQATIASAVESEQNGKARYDKLLADLRKAEGALLASGGAAADERVRDLEVALTRAHEKQSALDDEYEAWRLLTQTLKEAERGQATHLGNVLAPDLATRFQSLAGARYTGVALGPNLGLEGIGAAGGQRELGRLSIGTREQLSTLFRLCLAERLGSALLLDDQLVQSDPDRLHWFRRALRQTAATGVQVVVLTCRPDDYLELAESPPPHIIDLGTVVTG